MCLRIDRVCELISEGNPGGAKVPPILKQSLLAATRADNCRCIDEEGRRRSAIEHGRTPRLEPQVNARGDSGAIEWPERTKREIRRLRRQAQCLW